MKSIFLALGIVFSLIFLVGCGSEEATTIVEDNGSFKDLKNRVIKTIHLIQQMGKQ